jgi:hypothetical protein
MDSTSQTTLLFPIKKDRKVFDGFNACAYTFCNQGIVNRPFVYSSPTIRNWAMDLKNAGKPYPEFYFDSTLNYTDCAGQIADPSKGGHQLDNWNRTWNMATYFATKIDTADCWVNSVETSKKLSFNLYPNPNSDQVTIIISENSARLQVYSITSGTLLLDYALHFGKNQISTESLSSGVYTVVITTSSEVGYQKMIIQKE